MTAGYDGLWRRVRSTVDEGESVRTLVNILSSKDGRTFISNLEPSEAKLCIEILDHVTQIRPSVAVAHRCNDSGLDRAQTPLI